MTLRLAPLHPLFAAEVGGLDLSLPFGASSPFGDAVARALREALRAHRLLVFRGRRLSPAEQLAVTCAFGAPEPHAVAALRPPGRPEIVLEAAGAGAVHGRGGGFVLGGPRWHADLSWTARPNRVSALHARSLPPAGAATLFADQCAAFDRLDPWLAHRAQFLEAERDPDRRRAGGGAESAPPRAAVAHPVVRIDPDTGRRGLFVDEDTTARLLGVPEPEAGRLLRRLLEAATDPAVAYRHEWRPGDLVVWDNHAVLHRAEPPDAPAAAGRAWRMRRTMAAAAGRPLGPAQIAQPWVVAG